MHNCYFGIRSYDFNFLNFFLDYYNLLFNFLEIEYAGCYNIYNIEWFICKEMFFV